MKNSNEYYIVVPKKLDLEKLLKEHPVDFNFNKDFAYFVVGDIFKSSIYKLKDDQEFSLGDVYVPMCSTILQRFEKNYRLHMRYLSENGKVLYRQDYSDGSCYSYQLHQKYYSGDLKVINLTDKKLIKKIRSDREEFIPNKLKKHYNFLIKYLDPNRLNLKFEEALCFLKNEYKTNKKYKKKLLDYVKLVNLKNEELYFSYNPNTDGRVHSNVTSFPKKLRKFLRYDGKKIAEIDISSSVPTFLYFLLSNINSNNIHLCNIVDNTKSYYSHYMLVKNSVDLDIIEIERFGKLIFCGSFYSVFVDEFHRAHYIMNQLQPDEYYLKNVKKICGRDFDGDENDLIKVVKKNMLSMFNAQPKKFFLEEIVFWSKFPIINYFIMQMKSENHKYFSYLMLQIESYFMLHIVARKLNNEYKRKIPILTLHDCIITTEDNMLTVYDFIRDTLKNKLGFEPKLTIKVFE